MTVDVTGRRVLRALALSLCFGTAALPGAAHAQFFGWNGWDNGGMGGLPGPQVRRVIMQQGFRVLGPLRRNGDVFVADVIDRRGRHERLIVASSDAQILQRFYVDDGRSPGVYARGDDPDEGGGLVPPADIPGAPRVPFERPRRSAEPPAAPARRYGDLDGTEEPGTAAVAPPALRTQPPITTVRPGSRMVDRAPETPDRRPAAVEAAPLAPVAPRPRAVEPPARAAAPKTVPATVASRPDPAAAPSAPAAAAPTTQPRRMTDPLAIPGGPAKTPEAAAPAQAVSGAGTGAAAAAPAAKPGDVPAAPLD